MATQFPSDPNGFYWYAARQVEIDIVHVDDGTAPDTQGVSSTVVGTKKVLDMPATEGRLVWGPYNVTTGPGPKRGEWWLVSSPTELPDDPDRIDVTQFMSDEQLPKAGWIRKVV